MTLVAVGCLALLFGAACGAFKWRYIPSVPEPDFGESANQLEAYTQDLDYLSPCAQLEFAFKDAAKREAFHRRIASLRTQLETMTPERFEVVVAEAVAASHR